MAPAPAPTQGTTEPTARNFDATATPHSAEGLARGSHATIENVIDSTLRTLCQPAAPNPYACAACCRLSPGFTGYQHAARWLCSTSPRGGISFRQFWGTPFPPATWRALG